MGRDYVDGQLPQVGVELTREAQAGRNTGHVNRQVMGEIAVCRGGQLEGTKADIVQSLVLNTESPSSRRTGELRGWLCMAKCFACHKNLSGLER